METQGHGFLGPSLVTENGASESPDQLHTIEFEGGSRTQKPKKKNVETAR